MVAGLAAGIDRALFFVFEKLDQFRDGGLFDAESFLTWMGDLLVRGLGISRITGFAVATRERGKPGRLSVRRQLEFRFWRGAFDGRRCRVDR